MWHLVPAVMAMVTGAASLPAAAPLPIPVPVATGADTVRVAPPTGRPEADRASILAALERVRPGGAILFASGLYRVGQLVPVTVPGITLLGHPDGTVLRGCEPAEYDELDREAVRLFQSPDPVDPRATWEVLSRCGMMELTGGGVTIRNLIFEYSRLGIVLGCCGADGAFRPTAGGYLIEGNTFRNAGNSIRARLSAPEPTVIRNNRFINTFHALSAIGSRLHFIDNHLSVPEPADIPGGHPGFGVSISGIPATLDPAPPAGACDRNVIAGNHVEGHPNGIFLTAYDGAICTGSVIRDNTIIVRRGRFRADWPYAVFVPLNHPADSTFVGVPLTLWAGADADGAGGFLMETLIEGNRILGAEGVGLEITRARRSRIVDNTIRSVVRREPYPGNLDGPPPGWSAEQNGSGIWVSAGSDENEIIGNIFEDVATHAVVLEGDHNHVVTRSADDTVRDDGTGNRVGARSAAADDVRLRTSPVAMAGERGIVRVAPPTGDRRTDRPNILAALESSQPGDTILFAPGVYVVGEIITVGTPRLTWLGHPDGTTLRGCDLADFVGARSEIVGCNTLVLAASEQMVSNLTFQYVSTGLGIGMGVTEDDLFHILPPNAGGHHIIGNTFRDSHNGIRAAGNWAEPVVIRDNQFINTFHAVALAGSRYHLLDNDISVPEPGLVPRIGSVGYAVHIMGVGASAFGVEFACEYNIVARNRVEGHADGIQLFGFEGGSCRENTVRDNTIVAPRPVLAADAAGGAERAGGVPLLLANWGRLPARSVDQDSTGVTEANLIEGNRVVGAEGVGIAIYDASHNRIINNALSNIARRDPFPGGVLNQIPGERWLAANGSGIWVSPGSEENEILGNTFEDIASYAVVLEGDRNRVQTRSVSDRVRDLGSGNRVSTSPGAAAPPAEIDALTDRFLSVLNDETPMFLAPFHTADARLVLAGGTVLEGRDAIVGEFFRPVVARIRGVLPTSSTAVGDDRVITVTTTYSASLAPSTTAPLDAAGGRSCWGTHTLGLSISGMAKRWTGRRPTGVSRAAPQWRTSSRRRPRPA